MSGRFGSSSSVASDVLRQRIRLRPRVWGLMLLVGILAVGAHFLWRRSAPTVARNPQYLLTSEGIHITPPPPWIRTDLKAQVLRDAALIGTVSVLDDWSTLTRRVKDAFEFHPWVASVDRITKRLPAALEIELTYRQPIAAVESRTAQGVTFLPIDAQGVRLPESDLTEAECRYLPRISGVTGRPLVGDVWTDPRVIGGASLIGELADIWQQLKLVEIIAALRSTQRDDAPRYTFELVTTGGTRIVWGAVPGQETLVGELTYQEKRRQLLDYAKEHGRLDSIDGPATIDVRNELIVTPRTARRKASKQTK